MAHRLYTELSRAVTAPGEAAYVVVTNARPERRPEYLVPKHIEEIRGWALYYEDEGGFSTQQALPGRGRGDLAPRPTNER